MCHAITVVILSDTVAAGEGEAGGAGIWIGVLTAASAEAEC